jgi:acetyl esterase/lipase
MESYRPARPPSSPGSGGVTALVVHGMLSGMNTYHHRPTIMVLSILCLAGPVLGQGKSPAVPFTRVEDVVYGRKYGSALTLDVFTPREKPNQAAVIMVMSGGWFSAHEMINPEVFKEFLRRGYTVFTVVHGSQPKYSIPEVMEDMHRSVRFIRAHARDYHIDSNRIGISGGSAGGHLSLMIGMAGAPGKPEAKDPVDRESSRVQAVGCFFPPTDFMNYAKEGRTVFMALEEELKPFRAPFDFVQLDETTRQLILITDLQKRLEIARQISPVTHVSGDDPPTLMIHGDADKLVPIQQAEIMKKKLEEAGVPVQLVVKAGEGHGWKNWIGDMAMIADWFDKYLGQENAATRPH